MIWFDEKIHLTHTHPQPAHIIPHIPTHALNLINHMKSYINRPNIKNSYRIRIKVRWCIDSSLQKIFWKFIQHTHLQTLVHFLRLPHTPMHTCAYPTHPHTQAHTHSHLHTPMYMYAQPHPPTYMYIYLHTHVHTCAHLCTPVHTCAHPHTPAHTRWCP